MKSGTVLLVGRPNVGKSTFVNAIIGQKVAITSPKAQTTRFSIQAVYQEERGQIIFVDTPGVFHKAKDALAKTINQQARRAFASESDLVIYMIDHTRRRDFEESRVLGMVRQLQKSTIFVINKIDIKKPSFLPQYKFLEQEFGDAFQVSALYRKHLKPVIDKIFSYLPDRPIALIKATPYPVVNLDSKTFIAEIIREKIFLKTRKELPYTTTVVVDEIVARDERLTYIKARLVTTSDTYKKMLIGAGGRSIKQIGSMARKELELGTGKKIYLDLVVETDRHWLKNIV